MNEQLTVGIIGAGTMGMGIAQVAARAGHRVRLYDARPGAIAPAMEALGATLGKLAAKGKITADKAATWIGGIQPVQELNGLADCGLLIEAVVEDLAIKKLLFSELDRLAAPETVLASNTSSLSITAIASACQRAQRVVGLHFFNPAAVMPLVEVVPGLLSDADIVQRMHTLMVQWGKTPVICKDTPGFIVNRVARPFYGESLRIFEEGIASIAEIDQALKSEGGFRMGPFELMDLIGNDVNFAVTTSVWKAFFHEPRYRPSFTQQRQVESGRLGRKTGQGYYHYAGGAVPTLPTVEPTVASPIVERILAMLINEAADALFWQVATAADIDLAMTKGVNYPKGLLAWADEQGAAHWAGVLDELRNEYGEERYRVSPLLRRMARQRGRFY